MTFDTVIPILEIYVEEIISEILKRAKYILNCSLQHDPD